MCSIIPAFLKSVDLGVRKNPPSNTGIYTVIAAGTLNGGIEYNEPIIVGDVSGSICPQKIHDYVDDDIIEQYRQVVRKPSLEFPKLYLWYIVYYYDLISNNLTPIMTPLNKNEYTTEYIPHREIV